MHNFIHMKEITHTSSIVQKIKILVQLGVMDCLLNYLSSIQICITAIAQTDCIGPMKMAMKARTDHIGQGCEALMKMFSQNEEALVEQVSPQKINKQQNVILKLYAHNLG